ncbi:NAD(P)H-binding protein [Pedobacter psychroterrae]|uniref:NAD-dependent epimerase/dehydratase family protein n=1 Tax=Pedobacter psychroterrae TaxID=2530453 RepID=A0A4R0NMQ7_9SPHI|nr:NAD(P)H-binding protein [Pedobacter psychroterrae]TCD01198.1 NAD-dependent epimerase/dehydratase family protein [Pedobacter psychroterrae]
MKFKALIIGATGATGEDLVDELLADQDYEKVTVFVRKSTGKQNAKLVEHIVDLSKPEEYADQITGDVFFSCLGTTLKAAGSKQTQWKIDFEIPAKFAAIAKQNNVSSCVLVSAYGASADSRIFYSRMKGELENRILGLGFRQVVIFKPGILKRQGSDRIGEKVAIRVIEFLNRLGMFKSQRPLPTSILAQKLAEAPKSAQKGVIYLEKDEIFR